MGVLTRYGSWPSHHRIKPYRHRPSDFAGPSVHREAVAGAFLGQTAGGAGRYATTSQHYTSPSWLLRGAWMHTDTMAAVDDTMRAPPWTLSLSQRGG